MTNIDVTYETVTTAAGDIRTAANDIKTQLDSLHSRVMDVVAQWEGEAKEAFHIKQRGWESEVTGLTSTLNDIANALDGATAGYQGTDVKAAQQFRI
ncbi:WXG100 family type VII secretion target [Streptomyces sp. TRM70308]|uniref:WXG100 family type VII secretion target n=1 Tax=Streptomyces sp. TRM70308 TaxID=3131932 RepID=UPI003D050756